jgi:hypothetical protein
MSSDLPFAMLFLYVLNLLVQINIKVNTRRYRIENMDTNIFLAQFLGWLLIIESVGYLFRPQVMITRLKDKSYTDLDGLTSLFLGVGTLILSHDWDWGWQLAVTFTGLALLYRGVSIWAFPDYVLGSTVKRIEKYGNKAKSKLRIQLISELVLGAFLLYASWFLA